MTFVTNANTSDKQYEPQYHSEYGTMPESQVVAQSDESTDYLLENTNPEEIGLTVTSERELASQVRGSRSPGDYC